MREGSRAWTRKNVSSLFIAAAVVAAFLFNLAIAKAQQMPAISISEVMWDGTEYVELINTGADPVNISDWQLVRQKTEGSDQRLAAHIPEPTILQPKSHFLIERNEGASEHVADLLASSLTLLNSGEVLFLYAADETEIDRIGEFGEKWWAGINNTPGHAMERHDYEIQSQDSWHTAEEIMAGRFGTPGTDNSPLPANTAPTAVIEGPDSTTTHTEVTFEAVEIFDADSDELSFTWSLGDGGTATGPVTEHAYSSPGTYTVSLTVADGTEEAEVFRAISVTHVDYSDAVRISEVLPNPIGADATGEFIELYNEGSKDVALGGWQLDDSEGGSVAFTMPDGTTITAGEYQAWYRPTTKIALNNGGDSVRLIDPIGTVKDELTYDEGIAEGSAFIADDGQVISTTTATPEAVNQMTSEEEEDMDEEGEDNGQVAGTTDESDEVPTVSLADIRQYEDGEAVVTEGTVSAPLHLLGKNVLYISGSGIQVYVSKALETFRPKLGDRLTVAGELSSIRGERRLKVSTSEGITVIASGDPPTPKVVETAGVGEAYEGSLVTIQGEVTETSGNTFYIDDGSGAVKVYIKSTTAIDKPPMKKEMAVTITGIVSETTSGHRLLPRFSEDIRFGLVAGLTSFPATGADISQVTSCSPLPTWRSMAALLKAFAINL